MLMEVLYELPLAQDILMTLIDQVIKSSIFAPSRIKICVRACPLFKGFSYVALLFVAQRPHFYID